MKLLRILLISLSLLSAGALAVEGIKNTEPAREVYTSKDGELISIRSGKNLYHSYLSLSHEMERLQVESENKELDFFTVTDKEAGRRMIFIRGAGEVLMLSGDIDEKSMPYRMLEAMVERGVITREQYTALSAG